MTTENQGLMKGVLFNKEGTAVCIRLADGTERQVPLKYRLDVEGVDPLVHGLLTMTAAVVDALDRIAVLEQRQGKRRFFW